MTETIRVAHDWDSCVVLNVPHETVAASRDDQVDVLVESEERRDLCPGLNGLDVRARKCGLGKALRYDFREQKSRLVGFFSSFQNCRVAWRDSLFWATRTHHFHSPDLMARAAMFTTTSGRASKMTSRTPIGQETR